MDVIGGLVVYTVIVVIYALVGGFLIEKSIVHFKRNEYFYFGVNLMLSIPFIVGIVEAALAI